MIEVILLERIDRLGHMGQVVKVRPGFARNFLLPQQKALRATKANLELFDKQRAELEARNTAARGHAETFAKDLDGLTVVVIRQASEMGQLYGSVSARDVSDAAKESGHDIQRAQVQIDTPIKTLGLFPVKVKLHAEVSVTVTVNVARSPEEAAVAMAKDTAAAKAGAEKAQVEKAFLGDAQEKTAEASDAAVAEKPAKKTKTKAKPAKATADEGESAKKPAAAPKKKKAKS